MCYSHAGYISAESCEAIDTQSPISYRITHVLIACGWLVLKKAGPEDNVLQYISAVLSRTGVPRAFGGIALIVPMLLMTLRNDLRTSLITASVVTAIFAVILALSGRDLGWKDVLAATAADAAVLVVIYRHQSANATERFKLISRRTTWA